MITQPTGHWGTLKAINWSGPNFLLRVLLCSTNIHNNSEKKYTKVVEKVAIVLKFTTIAESDFPFLSFYMYMCKVCIYMYIEYVYI